jgi:hypothetical protein
MEIDREDVARTGPPLGIATLARAAIAELQLVLWTDLPFSGAVS